MPLYEYRCDACQEEFERLIRPGDDEPDDCPSCGESDIERLISNTNFQLKGSGWYETDYARNDDAEGGGSDDGDPDVEGEDGAGEESTGDDESSGTTEQTAAAESA